MRIQSLPSTYEAAQAVSVGCQGLSRMSPVLQLCIASDGKSAYLELILLLFLHWRIGSSPLLPPVSQKRSSKLVPFVEDDSFKFVPASEVDEEKGGYRRERIPKYD
jgi:hypothetical protein